ncbi:MAG: hypothetical protein WCP18_00445 [bacterium]
MANIKNKIDFDALSDKFEKGKIKKKKVQGSGFSAQKKVMEVNNYYVRNKKKK